MIKRLALIVLSALAVAGCGGVPNNYGQTASIDWSWNTTYPATGKPTALSEIAIIEPVEITPQRRFIVAPEEAGIHGHGVNLGGGGTSPCNLGLGDNGCANAQSPLGWNNVTFTPASQDANFFYNSAQTGQVTCTGGSPSTCNTAVYAAAMRTAALNEPFIDYLIGSPDCTIPGTCIRLDQFDDGSGGGTVTRAQAHSICKYWAGTNASGPLFGQNINGGAGYIYCNISSGANVYTYTGLQNIDLTDEGGGHNTSSGFIYLKGTGTQTGNAVGLDMRALYWRCNSACISVSVTASSFMSFGTGSQYFAGLIECQFCEVDGGLDPTINATTPPNKTTNFVNDQRAQAGLQTGTDPASFICDYCYVHNLGADPYTSGSTQTGGNIAFTHSAIIDNCLAGNINTLKCHAEIAEQGGFSHTRVAKYDGNVIRWAAAEYFLDFTATSYQVGAQNAASYKQLQFTNNLIVGNPSSCTRANAALPFSPLNPGTSCTGGGDAGMIAFYWLAEYGNVTVSGNVMDVSIGCLCYNMGPGPTSGSSQRGGFSGTVSVAAGGVMTVYGVSNATNYQTVNVAPGMIIHENHGHWTGSITSNVLTVPSLTSGDVVNPGSTILHEGSAGGAVGRVIGTQITGPGGCASPSIGSGSCPAYGAGTYNMTTTGANVASETMDTDSGFTDTQILPTWNVNTSPPFGGTPATAGGTFTPWAFVNGTISGGVLTLTSCQYLTNGASLQATNAYGYLVNGSQGTITGMTDCTHYTTSITSSAITTWYFTNLNSTTDPTAPCTGGNQTGGGEPNCGTLLLSNTSEPVLAAQPGTNFSAYESIDSLTIGAPSYYIQTGNLVPTLIPWSGVGVRPKVNPNYNCL